MVIIDQDINIVTHKDTVNTNSETLLNSSKEDIDDPPQLSTYSDIDEPPTPPYKPDSPLKSFQITDNNDESNINKNDFSSLFTCNKSDNNEILVMSLTHDDSCKIVLIEPIFIMNVSDSTYASMKHLSKDLLSM